LGKFEVLHKVTIFLDEIGELPVEWEKFRISQALKQSDGNKAEAARRLGVHRRLLYKKIRKLGLDAPERKLEDETLNSRVDP
jgi:transcriptional regulator with GAF, ATPase, and Fis domain